MSLHEYTDLTQGSDEWLAARRGIVTASTVGQLITAKTIKPAVNDYSRALTATLVAERITGWTEEAFVSAAMMRGNMDEPIARDHYSRTYAPVTQTGFMVRDDWGYPIGYSPDGLVGGAGLIEIKSREPKKHLSTILSGEVPPENVAQIEAGLLVSGREWCDYVSYCGGMPMWVKRVYPDSRWFDAITDAVETFERTAAAMVDAYTAAVIGLPTTERINYFQEASL
ncbi:MAG: YqaJ viral recombinase family protein [Propionibacterium sp.]|nr:YqaJ viral recombinase family protein [Propionibacterium sp.]